MALDQSPRKRPRLDITDEESDDSDLFNEEDNPDITPSESQDDAFILASQSSCEPWQRWTVEKVAEHLIQNGVPADAVQKFKGGRL